LRGEPVVLDAEGRSSFQALQAAIKERPEAILFYAFALRDLDAISPARCRSSVRPCSPIWSAGGAWARSSWWNTPARSRLSIGCWQARQL